MSITRAIVTGLLWVNGPVLIFLLGPILLLDIGTKHDFIPRSQGWLILPMFGAGFVVAWLWWSFTVPKWRLWAYQRVSDISKLKEWAVTVGLTWSDGSPFGRTEIKSRAHADREKSFDPEADKENGAQQ